MNRKGNTNNRQKIELILRYIIRSMIKIYNDSKNLTCKIFNTDKVLRWILPTEEHDTDI